MKLKRIAVILTALLLTVLAMIGCGKKKAVVAPTETPTPTKVVAVDTEGATTDEQKPIKSPTRTEEKTETEASGITEGGTETETVATTEELSETEEVSETVEPTETPVPTNTPKPTKAPTEAAPAIDENGSYYSKDEVALYIHTYGKLPGNFIKKKDAEALGWSGGSVEKYAPGKAIGGDRFGNYEGLLPTKDGRKYTECDIDTKGKNSRGAKRIIFSNDGLIYYTDDHYETFTLLYGK